MADAETIIDTLEQVAARCPDPADKIYARLFELNPDYEAMFVMDTDGGVRGAMLQTSIDCVIGVAEGSDTPRRLIEAARMIHDGYGVRDDELDTMFIAMRDVFRTVLGDAWTAEIDKAWTALLAELATIR